MSDNKNLADKNLVGRNFPEKENYQGDKAEKEAGGSLSPERERGQENDVEKNINGFDRVEGAGRPEFSGGIINATKASQKQKNQEVKIEKILEEGMEDVYKKLPAQKQLEFRIVGERTVKEINLLMEKAKFSAAKILELIKKWLSVIPGVNNFFIEQEAKIKTDKIIKLKNDGNDF